MVPGAVEGLQLVDRHALDVGALADGRIAVVVPWIGELLHALEQHRARAVLAHLELVAHHGHLAVQVLARDARGHHAVGLHGERPVQVFRRRREGLEVVGAVVRGRPVPARAAARQLALDVGEALRALEQHVLEEVRHAFLAVALVARADEVHDVHGDRVGARIGQREHLEAVRQPVLGDALDRHHALRQLGSQRSERPDQHYRGGSDSFHSNQWNKWSAARPARMVAKVRRQRHATAIATTPAAICSYPGERSSSGAARAPASRLFLAALFVDAGLQLFAALVLAGFADFLAACQALLAERFALGGVLRFRAHLLHHALVVLGALLAFAGGARIAVRGFRLGRAVLAGLGILRLRAHRLHHALAPLDALLSLAGLLGLGVRGFHLRHALLAGLRLLGFRAVEGVLLRVGAAREQRADKENDSFHGLSFGGWMPQKTHRLTAALTASL